MAMSAAVGFCLYAAAGPEAMSVSGLGLGLVLLRIFILAQMPCWCFRNHQMAVFYERWQSGKAG